LDQRNNVEFGVPEKDLTIFCDRHSAIHLSRNHVHHERTKHIDVRLHFVRDIIVHSVVMIEKVHIADNPTDMATKVLPVTKFKYCLQG